MPRISAFRGTWNPNRRPWVTIAADAYVAIQGQTDVIGCGECKRKIDFNKFVTGISTEASVDAAPGSAQVTLSIPDNSINDFYVDGQLVVVPMMEIEFYAKGFFTVGGYPQYYRIFWGLVSSVSKAWSNGVTTITVQCKDILRWWELTNLTTSSAFLAPEGSSHGNFTMFQNQLAGLNPYTVILTLARESMGDFSATTGSMTSFRPEFGKEQQVIGSFMKDIMAYWQMKFSNIWNSLVLYGTTGRAYTFTGNQGQTTPMEISKTIFADEAATADLNAETSLFKIQPSEIAAFKVEVARAGDVDFFQTEQQSKLSIAMTARDQAGYEFYCDTTGDIIFKPPFYNLNVLPNKPVSWIQDHDIMEDSITDSEAEVFTHITSSGNAFGGTTDWGLNDEITTPRASAIDYHLLRRYGWRRLDHQVEWAGNPRKLFYHLVDYLDRINAKRQSGTITIPLRPEIRMGFPVWIPKYDSFFYIQGVSHNFSPGGQATTTLTLTAKRSKFIAPKNIGLLQKVGEVQKEYPDPFDSSKKKVRSEPTFKIEFPTGLGETTGVPSQQTNDYGTPAVLRDPTTGKLLGFPNAVMVFRQTFDGTTLARLIEGKGSTKGNKPKKQDKNQDVGNANTYQATVADVMQKLNNKERGELIQRLRAHRYESGMTNMGLYDYAHDADRQILEFSLLPTTSIDWGQGTEDPNDDQSKRLLKDQAEVKTKKAEDLKTVEAAIREKSKERAAKSAAHKAAIAAYNKHIAAKYKGKKVPAPPDRDEADKQQFASTEALKAELKALDLEYTSLQADLVSVRTNSGDFKRLTSMNIMVRPVSDDFGFEVIGHHRYGRNAFIDRGKVQINDPHTNSVVNQINVQFAATGGLLTETPRTKLSHLRPTAADFAKAFEQMQPEEYVTGASFKGGTYGSGNVDSASINPTSQTTYTNSANASAGKSIVYAEADAIRKAKTLEELRPQLKSGLDDAIDSNCSCQLGRSDWLSVLPATFIADVLQPRAALDRSLLGDELTDALQEDNPSYNILVAQGSPIAVGEDGDFALTPGSGGSSFFQALGGYLKQLFEADYADNKMREEFATTGGVEVFRDDPVGIDNSRAFPLPQDSLFQRAALGDPDALDALTRDVNFNFDRSEKAVQEFGESRFDERLGQSLADLPGSVFLSGLAVNTQLATGGLFTIDEFGNPKPSTTAQVQPAVDPPYPKPEASRRSSQEQGNTGWNSDGTPGDDL